MDYIPDEIWISIFDFIDVKTHINILCKVDKRWNILSRKIDFKNNKYDIGNLFFGRNVVDILKRIFDFFDTEYKDIYLHIPVVLDKPPYSNLKFASNILSQIGHNKNNNKILDEKKFIFSKYIFPIYEERYQFPSNINNFGNMVTDDPYIWDIFSYISDIQRLKYLDITIPGNGIYDLDLSFINKCPLEHLNLNFSNTFRDIQTLNNNLKYLNLYKSDVNIPQNIEYLNINFKNFTTLNISSFPKLKVL